MMKNSINRKIEYDVENTENTPTKYSAKCVTFGDRG